MIVCHCHGLTDREIRAIAERSAARCCEDLGAVCPAGQGCGGCQAAVDRILADCAEHRARTRRAMQPPPRRSA